MTRRTWAWLVQVVEVLIASAIIMVLATFVHEQLGISWLALAIGLIASAVVLEITLCALAWLQHRLAE